MTVPTWRTSRRADDSVTFSRAANAALQEWADAHDSYRLVDTSITPGRVDVVIAGPASPPDLESLRGAVATDAYPSPTLDVEWVESSPLIIAD